MDRRVDGGRRRNVTLFVCNLVQGTAGRNADAVCRGLAVQRALELLERDDAKLADVGLQVGYETDAAFSKASRSSFERLQGNTVVVAAKR